MPWPATHWYLPGGKGMVHTVGGVITAVPDADECCCEGECECPTGLYCLANYPDPLYVTTTGMGACSGLYTMWRNVVQRCQWDGTGPPPCRVNLFCGTRYTVAMDCDCGWYLVFDSFPTCVYWKCFTALDESLLGVYVPSIANPGSCDATVTVYS